MTDRSETRRKAIEKLAYVAPVVLSLAAKPAQASNGSEPSNNNRGAAHRGGGGNRGGAQKSFTGN